MTSQKKMERASAVGASSGGDGGNRTRVRRIRSSEIYERSRLDFSPSAPQPTRRADGQPLELRSP